MPKKNQTRSAHPTSVSRLLVERFSRFGDWKERWPGFVARRRGEGTVVSYNNGRYIRFAGDNTETLAKLSAYRTVLEDHYAVELRDDGRGNPHLIVRKLGAADVS